MGRTLNWANVMLMARVVSLISEWVWGRNECGANSPGPVPATNTLT